MNHAKTLAQLIHGAWSTAKHRLQHALQLNPCKAISELRGGHVWLNHECVVCGERGEWWLALKEEKP